MKGFGKNIKKYRKLKRLTQEELGKKLEVTKSYISKVESENTTPKMEFFLKVAELLGVDINNLFDDAKEPPQELKDVGIEWIILGEELEKEGITLEQVKQWAEIARNFSKNK